jgi:hypothetical protein
MNQILHTISSKCDNGERHAASQLHTQCCPFLATLRRIGLHGLSLQAAVVHVELKPSIEKNGDLYGVLESDNSRAKQSGTSLSDHFYIEIPQNTSAGVLQSSRVAVIIALFCPLRIIQCKYMVQLREKLGPRSTCNRLGTNLKSRPWIERLH